MILFSEEAALDLERLRQFLEEKSPQATRSRLTTIWTAIERLEDFPRLGAPRGDAGVRQLVIRQGASAYVVRYAILAEKQEILILRVWHGRETRL
jgi:plasmid stabilization system protein ParE